MIEDMRPATAKAKLALSRADLLGAMGYEQVQSEPDGNPTVIDLPDSGKHVAPLSVETQVIRRFLSRWWRGHPLSSVVQLSQPFLEGYAKKHPGRLVAYGAGTGALMWLLKPWKLLSAATMVTLVFKSSAISAMISDLLGKVNGPPKETARRVHDS